MFLGAEALNLVLKLSFARARPELEHPFVNLHTYSFPSGHATVSTAVYGALALVLARRTPSWRTRILIAAAAALVVGVIGFSRLYLGAHFLSDVLAGFDAGFTWLMLCTAAWILYRAHASRADRPARPARSSRPSATSPRCLQDHERDQRTDDRVADRRSQRDHDRARDNAEGDEPVDTGVVAVGDQGRAGEPPPRPQAHVRGQLVADEPDRRP